MGLLANILKHKGQDCSAGGISHSHDDVCIVNAEGPFDPDDKHPPVLLIRGPGRPDWNNIIAVPAARSECGEWVEKKQRGCRMNGGTVITSCDSRFGELVASLGGHRFAAGVNFHDRFETQV